MHFHISYSQAPRTLLPGLSLSPASIPSQRIPDLKWAKHRRKASEKWVEALAEGPGRGSLGLSES